MDRREFLAVAAAPFLLALAPDGCDLPRVGAGAPGRRRQAPLALVTADAESHVAVVSVASGRVRGRVGTIDEPRSIEAAGGQAVVAHTTSGAVSLLEGRPLRVRRVLRGMGEPRYTAVAPDGRHAYVTDSARGEVVVIDLERGRVAGGGEVGELARHVSIAPDGRTLWVALGKQAPAVVVADLANPLRPSATARLDLPFLAHDVACSPRGRRIWVTSGDAHSLALYAPGRPEPIAVLPAGAPPQHVSFGAGRAYVASGDDGSLRVQRVGDGRVLGETSVPTGSYNVHHGADHVVTPSLESGAVTVVSERGRVLVRTEIGQAAHDACLAWG